MHYRLQCIACTAINWVKLANCAFFYHVKLLTYTGCEILHLFLCYRGDKINFGLQSSFDFRRQSQNNFNQLSLSLYSSILREVKFEKFRYKPFANRKKGSKAVIKKKYVAQRSCNFRVKLKVENFLYLGSSQSQLNLNQTAKLKC